MPDLNRMGWQPITKQAPGLLCYVERPLHTFPEPSAPLLLRIPNNAEVGSGMLPVEPRESNPTAVCRQRPIQGNPKRAPVPARSATD